MSTQKKIEQWYYLNETAIKVLLVFVIILSSSLFFSNFRKTKEEQRQDNSMYTESTEVVSVDYEKIFGYARMDSAVPPLKGIKVKYAYQVRNQKFKGKQTFYLRGFAEIMNGIDKASETLEVRYKSNKPEESIITIKNIGNE